MRFTSLQRLFVYQICLWGLCLLLGCAGDKPQMLQRLEALEHQNSSGEPMLNDTLAESLVEYFDRHGDGNQRMRARYILGRTYFCMGELPRALEMYNEAADCADTTDKDCDFAKLSRVYAQRADIYNEQVQPRSQLEDLNKAEYFALKGNDTLMAIECYSLKAEAYKFLHIDDSVIHVSETAIKLFKEINRDDRASQVAGGEITTLINQHMLKEARTCIQDYELSSGLFDLKGDIQKGHEIYYYVKGLFYLASNQQDSAEYMFRKELHDANDLNNQISACRGLQQLYEQKLVPDSIAKYANLSYLFNDSAYSLSEMQNIQKFRASYNYNHHRRQAEQSKRDAERAMIVSAGILLFVIVAVGVSFTSYRSKKQKKLAEYRQKIETLGKIQAEVQQLCGEDADVALVIAGKNEEISHLRDQISSYQRSQGKKARANLETMLDEAKVVRHLNDMLNGNPVTKISRSDIRELTNLINERIPTFYNTLNASVVLRPVEYEICMLIRCHFKPSAISKLLNLSDAYVSNSRRRILHKVFGIDGNPKDLDERILSIV